MVSNLDRIVEEITKQADRSAGTFETEMLVNLAMEIVDQQDQHRVKKFNINQRVEQLIDVAANAGEANP